MNIVISFRLLVSVDLFNSKRPYYSFFLVPLSPPFVFFCVLLWALQWILSASSIILFYLDIYYKVLKQKRMRNSLRFKMNGAKVCSLVHRTIDGNGVDSSKAGKRNTFSATFSFSCEILPHFIPLFRVYVCECACVRNSNVYGPLHYFAIC